MAYIKYVLKYEILLLYNVRKIVNVVSISNCFIYRSVRLTGTLLRMRKVVALMVQTKTTRTRMMGIRVTEETKWKTMTKLTSGTTQT